MMQATKHAHTVMVAVLSMCNTLNALIILDIVDCNVIVIEVELHDVFKRGSAES